MTSMTSNHVGAGAVVASDTSATSAGENRRARRWNRRRGNRQLRCSITLAVALAGCMVAAG